MSDPGLQDVVEVLRLIHAADAALLGQRGRPNPSVVSEVMGTHRDAAVLLTRYLQSRGVTL